MSKGKLFFLKLFAFGGVIAMFFIAWQVYKEIERKKSVQNEIEKLQAEAEKIDKENLDISQKISYLESDDYKKREAKEKLNLQSPDENVVILTPSPSQKQKEEDEQVVEKKESSAGEVSPSNPQRWWNYFFQY